MGFVIESLFCNMVILCGVCIESLFCDKCFYMVFVLSPFLNIVIYVVSVLSPCFVIYM